MEERLLLSVLEIPHEDSITYKLIDVINDLVLCHNHNEFIFFHACLCLRNFIKEIHSKPVVNTMFVVVTMTAMCIQT